MAGEQHNDTVLSDVEEEEEDDQSPATLLNTTVTVDRFRELLSDLNREKKARQQSENSNSELQTAFNRLKILAHESIHKRNELTKSNEQLSSQVAELVKQLDESVRVKDLAKSDIETAANMLVTGIDNISGKVSIYKNVIAAGLPRSEKYTGLSAVCYGVVKRVDEIVEEILKQMEAVSKDRNEARELLEIRNYEIAIEMSQLESSISGLKDEVLKKEFVVESLENSIVGKDERIRNLETEVAGALEGVIKQSQLEIIELKHTVDELRDETRILKENAEAQAKELIQRREQVEELKEKQRVANDNVEGLMMDIREAEEEISRWKAAAQQEAELCAVYQELEEAKQGVIESEKKLKFKSETATAAMAARDAAEKSLRLADSRATRLSERVEELTRQLEQLDTRESQSSQSGARYVCWPWQWLGLNIVGSHPPRLDSQPHRSNEMELSEPLI